MPWQVGRSGRCDRPTAGHEELPPEVVSTQECLGEGWTAEEALVSALYCFLRSPDDFQRVVISAANTEGDGDSIACITGRSQGAG